MFSKEQIVSLLETNDKAVARALVVLYQRQMDDEQTQQETKHQNGRGFRPCHAFVGSSMAQFYQRNGYLSVKQVAYWRVKMADGNMRIAIYHRQLIEEAEKKANQKNS